MVENHYHQTLAAVRADVQLFLISNLFLLCFALVLSIFKARAALHLLPVSVSLTMATVLAASWYVFGQNWLLTILYGDYWGWGYLGLVGGMFLLLCDIALNKARISTGIVNTIGSAFNIVPIVPC